MPLLPWTAPVFRTEREQGEISNAALRARSGDVPHDLNAFATPRNAWYSLLYGPSPIAIHHDGDMLRNMYCGLHQGGEGREGRDRQIKPSGFLFLFHAPKPQFRRRSDSRIAFSITGMIFLSHGITPIVRASISVKFAAWEIGTRAP